ncbi:anthranilate phosphoribosyltransferase [Granulicella tundricola]|uniref:Anthranilate phosphoribosyltransferase n=1 Tax=Granulicella tundricola (strain ATCC BAA-1859 / DSM 23138 / MP5ACTX9) TaxID=1198114 RepID=E8X1K6_GRATM|nr:anthranilate phosphoribosyltransferase [Granulicella tundricola]ADW70241.1 anthranilate phosphoribosyltransferase [Granulicella tundricola MP5ACTX9]
MAETQNVLFSSLKRVLETREALTRDEAARVLDYILDVDDFGSELRVAALLGALAARGETEEELAGFVDALRARATTIPLNDDERERLVDTCGTGGDLSGSFNISTAAGLVAAAAGVWIAKHGNRAVTSRCGSADVLEAMGIPVDQSPESAAQALRTHGFAFLPAPSLQPAMKAVMPIRRAIGVRTAFNILGPMTNPAGARAQVLGVYAERLVPVVARTLARLETRHAFVVHGAGMDEFTVCGPTAVGEVRDGEVWYSTVLPDDFGLKLAPIAMLAGGDAETNAGILQAVFAGEKSARRDVVVMNAAAVLVTAGMAQGMKDGVKLAQATIDDGKVTRLVYALAEKS